MSLDPLQPVPPADVPGRRGPRSSESGRRPGSPTASPRAAGPGTPAEKPDCVRAAGPRAPGARQASADDSANGRPLRSTRGSSSTRTASGGHDAVVQDGFVQAVGELIWKRSTADVTAWRWRGVRAARGARLGTWPRGYPQAAGVVFTFPVALGAGACIGPGPRGKGAAFRRAAALSASEPGVARTLSVPLLAAFEFPGTGIARGGCDLFVQLLVRSIGRRSRPRSEQSGW